MMTETEALRQNYELGVLAGEAREQQRIIKLLDEIVYGYDGFLEISSEIRTRDDLIALIKGENK